jgi:hypothetical protein
MAIVRFPARDSHSESGELLPGEGRDPAALAERLDPGLRRETFKANRVSRFRTCKKGGPVKEPPLLHQLALPDR